MTDPEKTDPDDVAPDADDKGDPLPKEFQDLVHDEDIVPDNTDAPDPDYDATREDAE